MVARMSDVAVRAGVSAKTVSNVLNGYPHIRPGTRERVMEAIEALDYQINSSARSLRAGRTGIISLVIPEVTQPFWGELAEEVMTVAAAYDLTVLIELTQHRADREVAVVSSSRRQLVDGVIFAPTASSEEELRSLSLPAPTVVIGEALAPGSVDNVTMPNRAGSAAAVGHLLDSGCRCVAAIGPHKTPSAGSVTAGLRLRGYLDAHEERGVLVYPDLLRQSTMWQRASGAAAVRSMLEEGLVFDGLFCFNDSLAIGALHELLVAGVKVPDDIRVIGFDGTEDTAYTTPALSTVSAGGVEIARQAVRLLNRRMQDQAGDGGLEVTVPHQLIVRASTKTEPAASESAVLTAMA